MNKKAKLIAIKAVTSTAFVLCGRLPKLDMRFKLSREIKSEIAKLRLTINIDEIRTKKKLRAKRKEAVQVSIFENPLVKDLLVNRSRVRFYNKNVVQFNDGRNHYAKSGRDVKIIEIFAKHKN